MNLLKFAVATVVCLSLLGIGNTARSDGKLEYNRDIRPILAENCFACHGPDSAARKAELRLDRRDDAVAAKAIVPGKPGESGMVERINATAKSKLMPPPKSHKTLTAQQKEILKRWVAEGAEYQPHWSFIAPRRPAMPAVKNGAWVRSPLDRFVLAALEKNGLRPAPEADRRTLARRLSLDITGLPPDPAEVEAFIRDTSAEAYEKYVDSLLRSPHWGEHRGRYWLDAARYADTHGIHFDNYREMWSYRDWVIQAFNRNLPFDRFTIEQLAGDLLPQRGLDQTIASGFNRCNITTNEGGAIAEEYLVLYARDRTETTSQVWLGLTAGCAVCHDHKFDPLTMRDFYSMAAFFNHTTQEAMDGNIKDTPPTIPVPSLQERDRFEAISQELAELDKQVAVRKQAARKDFDKWLAEARAAQVHSAIPHGGLKFHGLLSDGTATAVTVAVDGQLRQVFAGKPLAWQEGHAAAQALLSKPDTDLVVEEAGDFDRNQAFSFGAWIKLTRRAQFGAVFARMDNQNGYRGWDLWLEENRIGTHIVHKWQGDAIKVVSNSSLKLNQWHHVFVTYDGSGQAGGVRIFIDGIQQESTAVANSLKNTIRTTVPLKVAQRHASERLNGVLIQDIRIYGRQLPAVEVGQLAKATRAAWLAARPAAKRSAGEIDELFAWYLNGIDQLYQQVAARQAVLRQEQAVIQSHGTIAHVMNERAGMPTAYILHRGDYDKRRDQVKADTPKSLPALPADLPRNRLGFAQWLLRPEHPLTARVTVNRFWQELFGTGIVRTSGDFGVSGELPSHPELLDWLAVEFRESGWDIKKFFKTLVMSATYRQSAVTTPEKLERDPFNRLLSRGPRFRMDAEMVRDYALASSGLLVRRLGGPSVKPYQPEGVWEAVAMIGSNTRDYVRDTGANLYRRSMYTFWKRAAPPASMDILNAPNRETCTVRRERTNTPLQALLTLNDPQFVEAARNLAQQALLCDRGQDNKVAGKQAVAVGRDEKAALDYIALRLLARVLRPEEQAIVRQSLSDLLAYYKSQPEDARKLIAVGESKANASLDASTLAAWTMLTNQLMNLDEVLNK